MKASKLPIQPTPELLARIKAWAEACQKAYQLTGVTAEEAGKALKKFGQVMSKVKIRPKTNRKLRGIKL